MGILSSALDSSWRSFGFTGPFVTNIHCSNDRFSDENIHFSVSTCLYCICYTFASHQLVVYVQADLWSQNRKHIHYYGSWTKWQTRCVQYELVKQFWIITLLGWFSIVWPLISWALLFSNTVSTLVENDNI